ncbi:Acetylcholine receptor subunit alpha-like 1 [Durusdinium trenchii]|uniref:Acetylcholine receptor subunit alpha-like 1 n=1 Tax=Durusdinium trenchii TaxID=1381693 RepID=A0ABP0LTI4_9DINO
MSASDQSVGLSAGVGDVLQRLAALEKRMDAIDSTEKGVLHKWQGQMKDSELELNRISGHLSGVKDTMLSQLKATNRVEEKLSSQMQALQASIQTCEKRCTLLEQHQTSLSETVSQMMRERALDAREDEQKLDAQAHLPEAELKAQLKALAQRVELALEGPSRAAPVANEGLMLKPQVQELQAATQRLRKEVLDVMTRLEEQAVRISSCRARLDELECRPGE